MKLSTLASAAIIVALTVGALAPSAALAAPATELDSTGRVTVEEGGDEAIGEIIDPDNPDVTIKPETVDPDGPEINENTDLGALMIERTSDLEFGTIKTSANDVTAFAAPTSFIDPEDGSKSTRGALVQWRDIRANTAYGYTITAQMTQQFEQGTNKLSAATIDFTNGRTVALGINKNVAPSTTLGAFQLTEEDNDAITVVTANKAAEEGKGRYTVEFGQTGENTADNSVKLTVPATTASNMALGDYTAKVTWKIVAAA